MKKRTTGQNNVRFDHLLIGGIVNEGASVLDLGCGSGELLSFLSLEKGVKGQGIEIDEKEIYKCVEKDLNVFHGDIDTGLTDYPDSSFDYIILNQSLQQVIHIKTVMRESLRVGRKVIIGFPNFAHLRSRSHLFFKGRAPVTKSLPFNWYDSPNLHFLSISDFLFYCKAEKLSIEKKFYISGERIISFAPNLLADTAIFVLSK